MNPLDLLILAFGVSRLTRLVVHDSITERLRNWIWYRWPASDTQFGDSEVTASAKNALGYKLGHLRTGVEVFRGEDAWYPTEPRFVGNVIACHWCASIWVGIIAAAGYWLYPDLTWFALPFALSEATGLLNDR